MLNPRVSLQLYHQFDITKAISLRRQKVFEVLREKNEERPRNWQRRFWQLGIVLALGVSSAILGRSDRALAQITPDATLGTESSVVTPNVVIKSLPSNQINGGAIRGANLFHSFQQFNIDEGRGAYFTNPAGIENILSRVTGSNRSDILGTLGVLGNANLFLINPNGIIFGQNASLDVGGSFVGTTANAIGFGNQGFFSASVPNVPTQLLTVNPSAFLFNQISRGGIVNNSVAPAGQHPAGFDLFGLRVPDGKGLVLLGGNVSMDSGRLNAIGGRVELGGLVEAGTVGLTIDGNNLSLSFPGAVARGDVSLVNGAMVGVIAGGGGSIAVNARNLDLLRGGLFAGIASDLGLAGTQAGDITLNAAGKITVAESSISNQVGLGATGNGGNINIKAGSVSLTNNAQLDASTFGQGNAGRIFLIANDSISLTGSDTIIFNNVESTGVGNAGGIQLEAGSLSLTDGAQAVASTLGQGNAGNVSIDVRDTVTFAGTSGGSPSGIASTVEPGAVGNGGDINIKAEAFFLTNGAKVSASTLSQGNGGNVFIQANSSVSLAGKETAILSTIGAGGVGEGGDINIKAGSLSITDNAQLLTIIRRASDLRPAGRGNGGSVNIDARDNVTIVAANNGLFTGIASTVDQGASGRAGDINIKTGSLSLTGSTAQLQTGIAGQGEAGRVFVQARDSMSLTNGSAILSTVEFGAIGKGNNIEIETGSLSLVNGAQLTSSTKGQGNAGNVFIQANNFVSLAGDRTGIFSGVSSEAAGQGGNIDIQTPFLSLTDSAFLTSATNGQGNAGNITVGVEKLVVQNGALIEAETISDSRGGDLKVTASDSVEVRETSADSSASSSLSTASRGDGAAGNLTITTGKLLVQDGAQIGAGAFSGGRGGTLNVTASDVVELMGTSPDGFPSGLFTQTQGAGAAGDITVTTQQLTVRDGAQAAVNSIGLESGKAGNLKVRANSILLDNQGKLIAQTDAGDGGNITLNVEDLLLMRHNSEISTSAGTAHQGGNGGNITINSPFIVAVPKEDSDITANAYTGRGGNINITTQGIYGLQFRPNRTPLSDITASSDFGVNGTVQINSAFDVTQSLTNLPIALVDASNQIDQTCSPSGAAAREGNQFVITGRGGLPPSPNEPLQGESVVTNWVTLDSQAEHPTEEASSAKPASSAPNTHTVPAKPAFIEAQGWRYGANGEVILTASTPTATPQSLSTRPAVCGVK